jgi:hypothetical protein
LIQPISFKRHCFPPDVIRYAVWLRSTRLRRISAANIGPNRFLAIVRAEQFNRPGI